MNDEDYNIFKLDGDEYEYMNIRGAANKQSLFDKLFDGYLTYYSAFDTVGESPKTKLTFPQLELIEKWIDNESEYPLGLVDNELLNLIKERGYYFDHEKIELNRIRKDYMEWLENSK